MCERRTISVGRRSSATPARSPASSASRSSAASLAGHLQLGRLVFVYDDNHITIDGDTALAFSDDVPKRFEAYGWHV